MPNRQIVLISILVVAVIAAVALWRASAAEPLAAFRTFPYTYIAEAAAGYDAAAVVIDRGTIAGRPSVQDAEGRTAWPAYIDPTGQVVPAKDGKPYLIPLVLDGTTTRTPVIKPIGRALKPAEIDALARYQTAEGAERLEAFRKEYHP